VTVAATSIRLIELADSATIAEHLARDVQASSRWDPVRPAKFYTAEGQVERIDLLLGQHLAGLTWPGVIVSGGVVIGQVSVTGILRGPFQKGFLGYWVVSSFQNRGHATSAVGLALQTMKTELGLHRAEARTQVDNHSSNKVLERNGFAKWGLAHSHTYIAGEWRDVVFWEQMLASVPPPAP
jgi:[ribosomal protein S5]-alanine N-acetyltransferase